MKTIYISGKIDGCDRVETFHKFITATFNVERRFLDPSDGSWPTVINPCDMPSIPHGTWQDYIERDLIYLKHCDTIYMLKDWKDSAGARVEHEFAKKLGLEIIYEEGDENERKNGSDK